MSGIRYVALGDSFAAGIGSRTPGSRCRKVGGYPVLVARSLRLDLAYQACLSATIDDVTRWQLDPLGPDTELVTLTVGGNDAGFAEVVLACAKPRCLVDGVSVVRAARRQTDVTLPRALTRLLKRIRRRAPYARLVVTGYPQIVGPHDCRWFTFFSPDELTALRAGTDDLVDLVLDVATHNDALPVDVRAPFAGHDSCGTTPWIHNGTLPFVDSFHPIARGHRAYADTVLQALDRSHRVAEAACTPATVLSDRRGRSVVGAPTAPASATAPAPTAATTRASDRPGPESPHLTTGPDHPTSGPQFDVTTLVRAGTRPPRTGGARPADGP